MKNNKSLKHEVLEGISKTGFPLEMEIGRILQSKDWHPFYSHFYRDIKDLENKELDIRTSKYYGNFEANLYIECKHSNMKQWAFFIPEESSFLCLDHIRYFPRKKPMSYYFLSKPNESIFAVLKEFCDSKNIALNSAVFQKKKKQDDATIRIAIDTCIGALIYNNLKYFEKSPPPVKKSINFAVVIFDGPIFAFKGQDKFNEVKYIKYKHQYVTEPWKLPTNIRTHPIYTLWVRFREKVGFSYIVEFIHRDYFSEHLDKLDKQLKELNDAWT